MSSNRLVAIACEGPEGLAGDVCGHFGHAPFFVVADLDGKSVRSTRLVAAPGHDGHGEGGCSMPQFVRQLGAQTLIVGGMGARAAQMLASFGIDVVGGVAGNAGKALEALAAGSLAKGDSSCSGHGGEGHSCGHHHG